MKLAFDVFTTPSVTGHATVALGDTTLVYTRRATPEPHIYLSSLRTRSRARRKGGARRAMVEFLAWADAQQLPVVLCASPLDRATGLRRLVGFYVDLGFLPTGRSCNPAGDPVLRRAPR